VGRLSRRSVERRLECCDDCILDPRSALGASGLQSRMPDKHWEEGEDLSLLDFKVIEYKRKGYAIATDEQLEKISKIPKRAFMRKGISTH